jgi:hypothetical protein
MLTVRHKQGERNRMTNLQQENTEIESHRTNSTFGFANTQIADPKKPKELFFNQR